MQLKATIKQKGLRGDAMSNKHLIIDGQLFQTKALDRGMGRYSVCLVQALIAKGYYSKIEILLTSNVKFIKQQELQLEKLFPGVKITYLNLKTTINQSIERAFEHNSRILDQYVGSVSDSKTEIDYLIPSPFQEPVVSVFPNQAKKLLLFYDLIPYLYYFRYQAVMQYENYLKRFRFIFEADCIFAISQSVADDLHVYLGVPKNRLIRIDGAPIRTDHTAQQPSNFAVPKEFVLMPTSDDPRKNNLKAVLGFEEYCTAANKKHLKLIVTSTIHRREREHLSLFSNNLVFTGNLNEPELNWLYKECAAVLFVPESEGLGLPVLEAVEANKKVVCSTIGVFKEISADAFFFCNHEDQQSIAESLSHALNPKETIPVKEYQRILAYYNWVKTADRFINGSAKIPRLSNRRHKPRIAMFTPTPNGYSAIGKVVTETHPAMSEYFEVDYYVEQGLYAKPVRPNYLQYIAPCFSSQDFSAERYAAYDAVIYHIGNGDYHMDSIKNALYLPGYAVLHDTNIKEAYRVLQETGMMHQSRVEAEEYLNKTVADQSSSYLVSLLNSQLGVLSHSDYAKKAAEQVAPKSTMVIQANLPTATPEIINAKDHQRTVIGLAGIIADVKGIEVIETIANNPDFDGCDIRLFGFSHAPQETIDRLNNYENVIVTTNLSDFDFQKSIGNLDIYVNYRLSYNGETSLSTIEAMRQGCAVIVRKIGWYDELPDDTVVKASNAEEVVAELKILVSQPSVLKRFSEQARRYIAAEFSHDQYVQKLLELLEKSSLSESINSKLAQQLKEKHLKTPGQYLEFFRSNQ